MALSNVALTNTFDEQRTRINQMISVINTLLEGNLVSSGTITLTNPSGFGNNITLNVAAGWIKGNGNGISFIRNTAIVGVITNSQLANANTNIISIHPQLTIANGQAQLGGNVITLNVSSLSGVSDTSTSNIPAASTVNTVNQLARAAFDAANTANGGQALAITAYGQANTATSEAALARNKANTACTQSDQAGTNANNAYGAANSTLLTAQGAFARANTGFNDVDIVAGRVQANNAPLTSTVITLTDGATVALNAALGSTFILTAAGNREISIPTNPTNGQKIIIAFKASGGSRTLTLNTAAGGFRYGSDITGMTATGSGNTDYIGCIYTSLASKWDVVAYSKGYV